MKIALIAASAAATPATHQSTASSTAGSVTTGNKRGRKKSTPAIVKNTASSITISSDIQSIDRDTVLINGIEIDIEKITDEQLYSLRKVLPRKDYR